MRMIKVFCLILLVSACGERKLSPLSSDDIILAFGDSLTLGVGAPKDKSYPAVLARLTGLKVINSGISGETTAHGLKRFENTLINSNASLVVLMEGGNDILRNLDLIQTKDHLAKMIQIAQALNVEIILVGVPEKKLFSNSAEFYQVLAKEYGLLFEEEILSELLRSKKYKSDPIHLNAKGYQKFAVRIHQLLLENGAF